MIATGRDQGLRRRRSVDAATTAALWLAGIGVIVPLFAILLFVVTNGLPALSVHLFTQSPGPTGVAGGGVRNSIVGSGVLVGLALLFGLPPALATGVYLAEYGRTSRLGFTVRFMLDVLAGVPSITIGVFVYTAVVLGTGHFSALAGGIALALILLPVVSRVTEEMMLLVPQSTREAAYGLGSPKWRTIVSVVMPAASGGILTGVILACARVAGEAAPLLFTALGNNFYSTDVSRPIDALPLRIYTYATGPFAYQHDQAWAGSLVLVAGVLVFSLGARLLLARRQR